MRTRLYLLALAVLAIGLASAAAIYLTADDEDAAATSYVIVGGVAYAVDPTTSKTYVRELERLAEPGGSADHRRDRPPHAA
jgi:hypothetical protein